MLSWWRRNRARSVDARRLFDLASVWSREPRLYADFGVADSIDGRMAMLVLHLTILTDRLSRSGGQDVARAVTEQFVAHVDDTLRHIGVGDLAVPRKVKKAAAALFDAHVDYGPALTAGEDAAAAWRHAIHLNLVSRAASPGADIPALAIHAMALTARLRAISDADCLAGRLE